MLRLMRKYKRVPKYILSGNGSHDGIGKETTGETGVAPFRPYATVISSPEIVEIDGERVACWPWQPDKVLLEEFLKDARQAGARILVAHAFLQGAVVGPEDYRPAEAPFSLDDFGLLGSTKKRAFDWGFFGDIHKRQRLGDPNRARSATVWYPGSPYAQNWGERELDKGCLYVDTEKKIVEPITIDAPRYRVFDSELPKKASEVKGDFVRVIMTETMARKFVPQLEELRETARHFELVLHRETTESDRRVNVSAAMSGKELLRAYIKATPPEEGIPLKRLGSVGYKLWKEGGLD